MAIVCRKSLTHLNKRDTITVLEDYMNIGQKLRYLGKSGQIKRGTLVEFVSDNGLHIRASVGGRTYTFRFADVEPAFIYASELPTGFIESLFAVQNQVTTRVLWPAKKDQQIQDTFSENGLILPIDARPLKNKQWDWSAEMRFPELPANLTPEGTVSDGDGWQRNSRRDVVLAVLKAGFPLTSYAKEQQ
jgi:hypothetical protein